MSEKVEKTITVEAVAKAAKQAKGVTYWAVMSGNTWYNLFVEQKPTSGQTFTVEVNDSVFNGKTFHWAHIAHDQAPQPIQPPKQPEPKWEQPAITPERPQLPTVRTTPYTQPLSEWQMVIRSALEIASEHGICEDAARVSLCATLCIAFGDGKISLDTDPSDNWKAVEPKPERLAAHTHLEESMTAYCGIANIPAKDGLDVLQSSFGTRDILTLTEKQAIAARLKIEELIAEKQEWKTRLTDAIKNYCRQFALDFAKEKFNVLFLCAQTKDFKALTNLQAKAAAHTLDKMVLDKLNDEVSDDL